MIDFCECSCKISGFAEARRACCGTGLIETSILCNIKSVGTCTNASEYVFWDGFHPTEAANKILSDSLLASGISLISWLFISLYILLKDVFFSMLSCYDHLSFRTESRFLLKEWNILGAEHLRSFVFLSVAHLFFLLCTIYQTLPYERGKQVLTWISVSWSLWLHAPMSRLKSFKRKNPHKLWSFSRSTIEKELNYEINSVWICSVETTVELAAAKVSGNWKKTETKIKLYGTVRPICNMRFIVGVIGSLDHLKKWWNANKFYNFIPEMEDNLLEIPVTATW